MTKAEPTLAEMARVVGAECNLNLRYSTLQLTLICYSPDGDQMEKGLDACRKFEDVLRKRGLGWAYARQLERDTDGTALGVIYATPEQRLRAAYPVVTGKQDADHSGMRKRGHLISAVRS